MCMMSIDTVELALFACKGCYLKKFARVISDWSTVNSLDSANDVWLEAILWE
jgi:hypothetical protein